MAVLRQVRPTTKPAHFATLLVMALAPESVGARIRQARIAKGWTHEQLARAMGGTTNLRTVQRWQKGWDPRKQKSLLPRLGTLMKLADVLEVPRSYFVEIDDPDAALHELREQVATLADEVAALRRGLNGPAPDARAG